MSASSRSLLTRLALAAAAMVVLSVVGYVGLGLIVRERARAHVWVSFPPLRMPDNGKLEALDNAYARAAAAFFPRDTDGDGASDGYEWYVRTDPRNAASAPGNSTLCPLDQMRTGFHAIDSAPGVYLSDSIVVGQRRRIVGRAKFFHQVPFARGARVLVFLPQGWRAALPGGALTTDSLEVPLADDGSYAFDLEPTAPANASNLVEVRMGSSAGSAFELPLAWAGPALTPVVEEKAIAADEAPPEFLPSSWEKHPMKMGPLYRLHWSPPAPPQTSDMDLYLIEARCAGEPASWWPVEIYGRDATSADILRFEAGPNPSAMGMPLPHFRVVPIRRTPPQ